MMKLRLINAARCILRAILCPKSHILLVCPDDKDVQKYYNNFQLLSRQHKNVQDEISNIANTKIIFKNGSSIDIILNNSEENTRGNRAKTKEFIFDWENYAISDETFEEICKSHLTK